MICFAILAHENEEILQDQVENLKYYNPNCKVVLYNGGKNKEFGKNLNIPICPKSQPLKKGRLGRFFMDVMCWLTEEEVQYDYLINLDSDVMYVKAGFEYYLNQTMNGYDCMGINMGVQRSPDDVPHWYPGQTMWQEWHKWKNVFKEGYFCGSLNSMQVYRYEIVQKMVANMNKKLLEKLIDETEVYALEEVLYPTLAVYCGAHYRSYPTSCTDYVRWKSLSVDEIKTAMYQSDIYFVHPIERVMSDPARQYLSEKKQKIPSSLTVMWGCYQGGLETAIYYRLKTLNMLGAKSHAYFYYGGAGLTNYKTIPFYISNNAEDLGAYINEHQFDMVTFVNTLYNLDQLQKISYKGKVCFEFHGCNKSILEELEKINAYKDEGFIKTVVVPSEYVAEVAKDGLKDRNDINIIIARNMIDTETFKKIKSSGISDHQPLPDYWKNCPIIGWVGRLDSNKNWKLLLRIFKRLKRLYPKVKLLIVSDLSTSTQLHDFYKKAFNYGLFNDFRVLANLPYEKMPLFYSTVAQSGGVLLSTSYSEGYPYNLIEAQACECPVVCTDIGGSREVVKGGVSGFTFPLINGSKAVSIISMLINNQKLHDKIGKQERDHVCKQNSIIDNIQAYLEWNAVFLEE
ncbi:glycosyltransferase family 4 protein [Bacillus taeanensis]|nr:glycosyltransferase [Bacillus taeanensis]